MVMKIDLYSFCLLTLILGVGSTRANRGEDSEDEEPEDLASSVWMKFLNESDGICSLKPLEEALGMGANKANLRLACRHIMRQAWSVSSL